MKIICLLAVLWLAVQQTHAQTISGKVYRLGTDTVIAGASVYYGGSMTGTSTDNNGNFQLQAQARQIPIIVSSVGYYSSTVTYKPGEPLIVYLKPKTEVLRTVNIRVDGMSRKDEIKLFTKEFIGTSIFARSCTITNIDDIDLFYSKKTKTLTASCDKPIIIENKKLGYIVSYFLDSFSCTTRNVSFVGNFIFKENIPTAADSTKIKRNRETAYKNSRMQFIRALWNHQLKQAGFGLLMRDTAKRAMKRLTADQILVVDSLHQQYVHLNDKLYIINDLLETSTVKPTEKFSYINKNGFYGAGLQWSGIMAQQRIGDLLPFEYRSEQELNASVDNTPALSVAAVTNEGPPAVLPQVPEFPSSFFFEKAYLHTDRDIYGQGDDIWYKAYVVNALDNSAINYSHNLYVELISPESKLIRRKTVRLENGLGNGDFKLAVTIPAGRYRLRAYTNWMRNFGDNFIFEKGITILNTQAASAAAATANNVKIKKAAIVALSTANSSSVAPTVRFFPEGGSLVEGISSVVAVKAENNYGKGIPVKGAVISSAGDTVSRFSCDSLGMGLFNLLPVKGQAYHAIVDLAGAIIPDPVRRDHLKFQLPAALSKGMALQVGQTDSMVHMVINRAGEPLTDTISMVIKHGGKILLNKRIGMQSLQTSAMLPLDYLPEGVSVITLYGHEGRPDCERLIYIHHPGDANKLTIATNKKSYLPKEQVTVTIQALPNASLSLAAVDAAIQVQPGDIVSYLNLQSEVKGRIENPDRYFDTTNINRFKQLDLLLLTQGWRDFIWKRLEDTILHPVYQPERGITITGRVRRVGVNKGLPGITVNMNIPKAEGQKVFATTTDSAGRFAIYDALFYGYQYISFSSRREGKIKQDGESKGGSGGYIQVDSLMRDTLPVNAVVDFIPDTLPSILGLSGKLNIPLDHQLKEVRIVSRKFPPEIHNITLSEQKDYSNVAQYLIYTVPGAHLADRSSRGPVIIDQSKNIVRRLVSGSTGIGIKLYYADGAPIDPDIMRGQNPLDIEMRNVLSVTINKSVSMNGEIVYAATLKLRPGSMDIQDYFDHTTADMVGYYKAREFYKPTQEEMNNNLDPRTNTIHWEPNITTNEKGEATVTFNNTSQTGNIRLVVEGVTDTGTPLVSTIGYAVK